MDKRLKTLSSLSGQDFEVYIQDLLSRQTADIVKKVRSEVIEAENEKLTEFKYRQGKSEDRIKEQDKLIDLLKRQIEEKENELNELRFLVEKKASERNESEHAKEAIQSELEKKRGQIASLEEKVQCYENRYGELEEIYAIFTALTEDTLNRLDNVFEKKDFLSFFKAGVQWENIEGLWNCARRKVIEENEIDTEHLIMIFLFFFSVYNNSSNVADYYIIQPVVGEKYNRERHSILGTETDGYVKQVRLPGYSDKKGKVIGKALIKV